MADWSALLEQHTHRQRGEMRAWRDALQRTVQHLAQVPTPTPPGYNAPLGLQVSKISETECKYSTTSRKKPRNNTRLDGGTSSFQWG